MSAWRKPISLCAAGLLLLQTTPRASAQQPQQPSAGPAVLRASTELVLVNVVAHDKNGNLVRDLKREDFTLLEDGKRQEISSFDFENVEMPSAGPAEPVLSGAAAPGAGALLHAGKSAAPALDARSRRLVLLFFDFSGMEPEQIERSVEAARKFVQTKMQPADLLALVSLATNLRIDLDFTDDRAKLLAALAAYGSGQGQGLSDGGTGSAEGAADSSGAFTADDTDFNAFNADRKLLALQSLMHTLGKLPQKKSLIYFSNGITQTGTDNQSALRAATAAAIRANVSIYSMDIGGLQAFPPGGEAQSASLRGQSAYSGAAVLSDLNGSAAAQDTLATLSADTGGKAFFDSNDFGGVFSQVQKDSSAYYVLGFSSSNRLQDGRFRRLKVQASRPGIKLDSRSGYYAGRDFEHLKRADREQQLEDELSTPSPRVDVSLYAGFAHFRQDESHYYLAVSLVVPGSQIPFVTEKERDNATIDVIGEVLESGKFPAGRLRDTVQLAVESSRQVRGKNVQYNSGFVLAPGSYHLKFIVRENQSGRMGSFESDVQIPDLRKAPLKMSSIVLGSQRVPAAAKKPGVNPLVRDQMELVPNITHVFASDQHLYLQYEVYDAAREKHSAAEAPAAPARRAGVRVLSSIEFLQGDKKIYESKPVEAGEVTAPGRKAVIFQMDLPLQALQPGLYLCQVNVIDDVAGTFSFPRFPLLIRAPAPAPNAGRR